MFDPTADQKAREALQAVRRDIGNLLFHFTKDKSFREAFNTLSKILNDGKLSAGEQCFTGGQHYICFTESPISEMVAYFAQKSLLPEPHAVFIYMPFGIAVQKEWLYAKGGRPVLYDDENTLGKLPDELKYKLKQFKPGDYDTTWEREWRIPYKDLDLDIEKTQVIVPNLFYAEQLRKFSEGQQTSATSSAIPQESIPVSMGGQSRGIFFDKFWKVFSLDLFGIDLKDAAGS